MIATAADGDVRRGLTLLEIAAELAGDSGADGEESEPGTREPGTITDAILEQVLADRTRRFDKGGEQFYDQISALHKSVRSSNPDAALYWLTRMLDGGCDPSYLARRLTRMAVEDIGLADPRALSMAIDAWETYDRLGSPEGELAFAQLVIYLASTAKSNAAYVAFKAAKRDVAEYGTQEVPLHLRNAPTKLMKSIGYGKDYRYDHDAEGGVALEQTGFPDAMGERVYYQPVERGMELKLKEEWTKLKATEERSEEDLPKVDLSKVHATDGVVVEGFDNTPIKFAKCCSPLPGDPIVGFITRGFGVSIHKQSCANAISSMKDPTNAPRWVKAYWADSVKDSYKAGLEIIALNRNELLQDVLAALADIRVPIYALNARQVENNCAVVSLTIGINNTEHLNRVVARLSKVKDVLKVTRS